MLIDRINIWFITSFLIIGIYSQVIFGILKEQILISGISLNMFSTIAFSQSGYLERYFYYIVIVGIFYYVISCKYYGSNKRNVVNIILNLYIAFVFLGVGLPLK